MKWGIYFVIGFFVAFILLGINQDNSEVVLGEARFVDATKEAGISYIQNEIDFSALHEKSYLTSDLQSLFSGGVAAGDFDNDGLVDLYLTKLDGRDYLYRNNGDGTFSDVAGEVGLDMEFSSNGAVFLDVDKNGFVDLFVSTINEDRNYLFINYDGEFIEEGVDRGIAVSGKEYGFWPTAVDYDGDGWMDMVTTHWDRGSVRGLRNDNYGRVFRNEKGNFVDATQELGVRIRTDEGYSDVSFESRFLDVDNDGDNDLAIAADFGNSRLYINEEEGFRDATEEYGFGLDEFGMGITIGDYNADGFLDIFVTSIYCGDENCMEGMSGNKLYRNNGGNGFLEVSSEVGVNDGGWGWNTEFFDYDLDGDLDLIMSLGMREKIMGAHDFSSNALRLWRNDGGEFIDVTDEVGLGVFGDGRDLVVFDFDNDSDLDIFVVRNGETGFYLGMKLLVRIKAILSFLFLH